MIAPHFARLATEHAKPKKIAFAKVNVDTQSSISRAAGVSAMPTFMIYRNGNCIETIKGANPSALSSAVAKAAQLADGPGGGGSAFQSTGRTLGGGPPPSAVSTFDFKKLINIVIMFVGLYLVSLFSARSQKEE